MLASSTPPRSILIALALTLIARCALAGEGQVVSLPMSPTTPKSGIRLRIDDYWVSGTGYRPIRLRIEQAPLAPTPADRTIDVEFSTPYRAAAGTPGTISGSFVLPEGQSAITATLAVPQGREGWYEWKVWVDGQYAPELSTRNGFHGPRASGGQTEYARRVLVFSSGALDPGVRAAHATLPPAQRAPVHLPDLRGVLELVGSPGAGSLGPSDHWDQLLQVDGNPYLEVLPLDSVPERWLDLALVDVVFIARDDLQQLAAQQSSRFQALRDWLATGTCLAVFGLDDTDQQLRELERLFGLPEQAEGDPAARGWAAEREQLRTASGRFAAAGGPLTNTLSELRAQEEAAAIFPATEFVKIRAEVHAGRISGSLSRRVGLGTLLALRQEAPLAPNSRFTAAAFRVCAPGTTLPQRTGVSLVEGSAMYGGLDVPGVGGAPTNTFRFLITLFVIGIGPVCYFTFLRMGRLYLLLVAVPAGAAVITLSLFGYAFLADGLGVQVRIASYTFLDQPTAQGVSFSRQTYYAGLAPSQGLVFPADTMALPIDPPRSQYFRGSATDRRLAWNGDRQRFPEGYFPSRSQAQMFALRSAPSSAGLDVRPGTAANTLRVTNRLETELLALVVRDADGQTYVSMSPLPAGAESTLTLLRLDAAQREFVRTLVGLEIAASRDAFMPYPRYAGGSAYLGALGERFTAMRDHSPDQPPPRHYRALARSAPHVPLGAEGSEVASIHLLEGRW